MRHNSRMFSDQPRLAAVGSLVGAALLAGCVAQPVRTVSVYSPPTPLARPYIYPTEGLSLDQIDRDRYQCYVSTVQHATPR